ncbi:MAG: FAD-dependent oxidoreductase [Clostridia bacterium]|nr:FAD-dependent oxidoreductase [Clostridia bacterium]
MKYEIDAKHYGTYDVVIAGGGPAGLSAGLAAARGGLKALLIENSGALGGTSTIGALPFFLGAYDGSIPYRRMLELGLNYEDLPRKRKVVGGIYDIITSRIRKEGGVGPCKMALSDKYPALSRFGCHDEFTFNIETGKRIFDELADEFGLSLLYYTSVIDTKMENNEIAGVYISNKDGISYVQCRALIDCTGDADLVYRSGFETYKGDKETGEMTAIGFITHIENIDCTKLSKYIEDGGDPWFLEQCALAAKERSDGNGNTPPTNIVMFPLTEEGVFMINGGTNHDFVKDKNLDGTNAKDLAELTKIGRKRAKWLVENLFRPYIPGAENCRLRLTAAYPGVRETRRIVGEKSLTEKDIISGTRFEDTIALAGRHFDLGRKGDEEKEKEGGLQEFASTNALGGGVASIPYGALIPRKSKNIIVAGRCISAEGQALGPVRVMSTCMALGEAAGVATIIKLRDNVDYKDINVKELQNTLRSLGAKIDV